MKKNGLGDRMKEYERACEVRLTRRLARHLRLSSRGDCIGTTGTGGAAEVLCRQGNTCFHVARCVGFLGAFLR